MSLPVNSFRPHRFLRTKFREGKFLLASEAIDLQLEIFDQLRQYIKKTYGDVAVGSSLRVDQIDSNSLVLRLGEAWIDGIPFLLRSGSDGMVVQGTVPANVTSSDLSATTFDEGGKQLDFAGSVANDNYSLVVEAIEEIVKEIGNSGAIDTFLEGTNVGEGTANKFRFVYKYHVVKTSDLTETPTYPLAGGTNHFVNEIVITPSGSSGTLANTIDITQDINGADQIVTFNNTGGVLPFGTDKDDFIFGRLIDSDGNESVITSVTTADGGLTVSMRLDREVKANSSTPRSGLPVITTNVPYRLVKRDHYISDSNGIPLGRKFIRVADFTFTSPNILNLLDTRNVTEIDAVLENLNIMLSGGGTLNWNSGTGALTNSSDFLVTVPSVLGQATISTGGSLTFSANGKVAYILLDRTAGSNYAASPSVVNKEDLPHNENVYVFAEREDNRVQFPNFAAINDNESGLLGDFVLPDFANEQDRNLHLVEGGNLNWTLGTTSLTFSADLFIDVQGITGDNRITTANSPIVLPSDNDVAYVTIDRNAVGTVDLTPTIVARSAVPDGRDIFIVVERRGSQVYWADGTSLSDGDTVLLGAQSPLALLVVENNVQQLANDLYTTPSLDGDGFANLDNPIQTLLKGYKHFPQRIFTTGTTNPTNVVRIEAPVAIEINGNLRRITSDIDIDITNAGNRDGSLTTNTWYYIYAIADSVATTFTAKFSTTAPTISTAKGGWYHPSNANWRFICSARYVGVTAAVSTTEFAGSTNMALTGPFISTLPSLGLRPFSKSGDIVAYYYKPRLVSTIIATNGSTNSLSTVNLGAYISSIATHSVIQAAISIQGSTTWNGTVSSQVKVGGALSLSNPSQGLGGSLDDLDSGNGFLNVNYNQNSGTSNASQGALGGDSSEGTLPFSGGSSLRYAIDIRVTSSAGVQEVAGSIFALGYNEPF